MSAIALTPTSPIYDHGLLQGLLDDDHTQYALLAGRSGGQTLRGGTAAANELVLRGSTNADRGVVRVQSPTVFDALDDLGSYTVMSYAPTYNADAGGFLTEFVLLAAPTVQIDTAVYGWTVVAASGIFTQSIAPNATFSAWVLFSAGAFFRSDDAAISPLDATVLGVNLRVQSNGTGGSQVDMVNMLGLSFQPVVEGLGSGDRAGITNQTAVLVAPKWHTVAGSTADLGAIKGVHCQAPAARVFGSSAGTEEYTSYHGLSFDNITGITPSGFNVVVHSDLVADSKNLFMNNVGGAASQDQGIYRWVSGGFPFVNQDNVGIRLGATATTGDIDIYWENTDRLIFNPVETNANNVDFFWSTAADFFSFNQGSGDTWGFRFQFDRFSFGNLTSPNPGSTRRWFDIDPQNRTPPSAGDWADFMVDSASNEVLANALAMNDVDAARFESPNITLTSGSVADASTVHVNGMATEATRNQGLWVENARSRFDGRLNLGETTLSQLTGNTDNLAIPTGSSGRTVHFIDADGAYNLTGIVAGQEGDEIVLVNTGANTITLTHDVTSTAANRFLLPGATSFSLTQYQAIRIRYRAGSTNRWIKVA